MKAILLSIKPEFVEKIISGKKKYEYRTRLAKDDVKTMLVYSTAPVKKVVAMVKIKKTLSASPDKLWEKTKKYSGISKEYYDNYFDKSKIAHAYELGEVIAFNEPKELDTFGISKAPQSFVYVEL